MTSSVRYGCISLLHHSGNGAGLFPFQKRRTTTLSATINSDSVTFSPNNTVNGEMIFTPNVTSNTGATLSAIQQTGETRTVTSSIGEVTTEYVTSKEMVFFDTPKTRSQIQTSIENRLRIIQQYLNRFYVLLNGWMID
jgi:hypothetical protein